MAAAILDYLIDTQMFQPRRLGQGLAVRSLADAGRARNDNIGLAPHFLLSTRPFFIGFAQLVGGWEGGYIR